MQPSPTLLHIAQLKETLIDFDIAVDDARRVVDRAVADLHEVVAARDAAARELASLVGQESAA